MHGADVARPGEVLAGRYRVEAPLGAGGMAVVYRAADTSTGRAVAVKLLRPEIASDAKAVQRLQREGEVLARLTHPAIVAVEAYGQLEDGRLYIVMELLEGHTLADRLDHGTLDPAELAPIIAGAAAGLAMAHGRGVVHRDLKPENIFLCAATDGGVQVKLLDFGISKVVDRERLTQTGQILGTPRYMAPEQLYAERDMDGGVDVYALGVILYECLAGQPPFAAAAPSELIISILNGRVTPLRVFRPDIDEEVEAVVMRAMARARDARYASVSELADAFLALASARRARASTPGLRPGMATTALGSMGEVTPPTARALEPGARGDLRPGTFSEFTTPVRQDAAGGGGRGATATVVQGMSSVGMEALVAPAPAGAHAHAQAAAPASAGPPVAAGAAEPAYPSAAPVAPMAGAVVTGPRAPVVAGGATTAPAGNRALWLVALALVAGGITAGALLVAFFLHRQAEAPGAPAPSGMAPPVAQPAVPAAPPAPPPPPPPVESPAQPAPEAAAPPSPEPPNPPATTTEAALAPAPEETTRRRRRRATGDEATSTAAAASPPHEAVAAPPPALTTARELLAEARAARGRGEPEARVELAGRALERGGGAAALRLSGDCLVAAGHRDTGLRTYERFCRLFPDHPAITEVRGLVDGMGGDCP